jgi:hypothetical protein
MFSDFKRFLFFLNDGQTNNGNDVELETGPDGWVDMQVEFQRSPAYWGVNRLLTLPLKFVSQGRYMIRNLFYRQLIGAILFIKVWMLDDTGFAYAEIYSGRLDITKYEGSIGSVSVPAVDNDFRANINAHESTKFSISLNQPSTINLELTPIALDEVANLLPSAPPDGILHADYFPPIQVVNNQQNSINPSVQDVQYGQLRNPDFSTSQNWCFNCQYTGKLLISNTIECLFASPSGHHVRLSFFDNTGAEVVRIADSINNVTTLGPLVSLVKVYFVGASPRTVLKINAAINVTKGQKLFLYVQEVDAENDISGITITAGQIDFSYKTQTPPTMCQALRALDLFPLILQAMNIDPSGPNLPVPFQSSLLSGALKNLIFVSADSIRAAKGSIYHAGDVLYPGVYKVLFGTATYNSGVFNTDDTFSFVDGVNTFTSTDGAVVQKTQSVSVGAIYNIGDTLEPGGTYLVEGGAGQYATYNGIRYNVGTFFKYFLGQQTFTGSDDTVFVKQTSQDPQIIISLQDFFGDIRGVQGGDAAFGWDTSGASPFAYIETLAYVFRKGIKFIDLGTVDKTAKDAPAIDKQGNNIKIGYKDQQYSSINGQSEVNSEQRYASGLLTPDNTIDLTCPDRADCLGIEEIRISQANTAASRSDNDTFMVWIKDNPEPSDFFVYYHPLRTEGLATNPSTGLPMISGVPGDYYNWQLSPKRNMLRGSRYLASIFYGLQGYQIRLVGADKNTALVTTDINGVRVAENDILNVSDLKDPYFIPVYWTVQGGVTKDVLSMINKNPFADLVFDFQGVQVSAFIENFLLQIGNDKPQALKLLLSPDNNLLDLIP